MPRFFFHVIDDIVSRDDEGLELADVDAARLTALAGIRSMICGQVMDGRLFLHHRVEVEEEDGDTVLSLTFGDALIIEP